MTDEEMVLGVIKSYVDSSRSPNIVNIKGYLGCSGHRFTEKEVRRVIKGLRKKRLIRRTLTNWNEFRPRGDWSESEMKIVSIAGRLVAIVLAATFLFFVLYF
ncbi:hypothetical protein ACFL13_02275 [Patescibacteria group bacterium]